jgi:tetratricopeptide (TPR) repeat protein
MPVSLLEIPKAFHLPSPNWDVIRAWVAENVSESDRSEAWRGIATQWLGTLNKALGGGYVISRGDGILLFAPATDDGDPLLSCAESALATVASTLGGVAGEHWLGPLVIMYFADSDTYYEYISQSYSEGEFGRSSGMCLRKGYVHVAIHPAPLDDARACVTHEITHACLSHLTLPLWLEEGITQLIEEEVLPDWRRFVLDAEKANEIRQYWREHSLQDFWWGKGFFLADEGQSCSYQLAQILFRLIISDHRRQLSDFVRAAHADDAGDSAARDVFGKGVAELAAQFLGPGSWEPVPQDAWSFCRRGVLCFAQGKHDRSIADYSEAVRLDPQFGDAYRNRGIAHDQLRQYALALADYRKAIELNPKDADAHNGLAWILATCSEDEHRDGARAVEHANKACELSNFDYWLFLDTLAAACAERGDFDEAMSWEKEALRRAPPDERASCKDLLKQYKEGKPHRKM